MPAILAMSPPSIGVQVALGVVVSFLGCKGRDAAPTFNPADGSSIAAAQSTSRPLSIEANKIDLDASASTDDAGRPVTPDGPVIAYGRHSRGNSSGVTVTADGRARFVQTGANPIDVTKKISEREILALKGLFSRHRICEFDAPNRVRMPDEGSSVLVLDFPDLKCEVQPDWRLNGPSQCAIAIDRLIAKLQK